MKESPLDALDAVRLVLEATEALGEKAQGLTKAALMERLRQAMRAGIEAIEAQERTVSFEEAAWASVAARSHLRPVSKRDLRHFVRRMLKVDGMAERPLRAMTSRECRQMLQGAFPASLSSYKKGRAILHSIFAYGKRQEWCSDNPVDRVEAPPIRERPIKPLTLMEIRRLVETAASPGHRAMQLALHLMLYCGIRPAEVQRLRPEDIQWKKRRIIIRPSTSKTGGGRSVPLRKPALLRHAPQRIPGNWNHRWRALRRSAGFLHWQPDALRHTFASYHAAYFRNLPALQLEMGHRSADLLRTRYASVIEGNAARFWKGPTAKAAAALPSVS